MTPVETRITHLERQIKILRRMIAKENVAQRLEEQEYLTLTEAVRLFGKSESTIRRLRKKGVITDYTTTRSGRDIRYSAEQLRKYFQFKP